MWSLYWTGVDNCKKKKSFAHFTGGGMMKVNLPM
jgi:hypothetical protein